MVKQFLPAALLLLAASAEAGETKYFVMDRVTNKRITLGLTVAGPTRQTEIDVYHGDFSAYGFGNYDYNSQRMTESDFGFDWTRKIGLVEASAGWEYISLPYLPIGHTQDVHGSVSLAIPLNPKLTGYWDFENLNGTCAQFSLSQNVAGFTLKGEAGYSDGFLRDGAGLSHLSGFLSKSFYFDGRILTIEIGGVKSLTNGDGLYKDGVTFRFVFTKDF